jgi:predicted permease
MQIGVVQGRDFDAHDDAAAPAVAIVNQTMARRRWPGESAIGKQIHYGLSDEEMAQPRTVVGVVRDARQSDWTSPADDEIYLPYYQRPDSMGLSYLTFVLRVRGNPDDLADTVRRGVSAFGRGLPVSEVAAMERVIADELWRQRLAAALMGAFAGLSVLLAMAGIYGVISHSMQGRTQEIGIRTALGAKPRDLVGMALSEGMKPAISGAAAGLLLALWLTRFLETLLFGVTAQDPLTFGAIVAGLLAICAAANLIPALRAARQDPLTALRQD